MIIYTRLFVPKGFDGITIWPFIFLRKKDEALLQHELVHYREQAWITPIWWFRYIFSKPFRLEAEVRAYEVSIKYGMGLDSACIWLMQYDKSLSVHRARYLLTKD